MPPERNRILPRRGPLSAAQMPQLTERALRAPAPKRLRTLPSSSAAARTTATSSARRAQILSRGTHRDSRLVTLPVPVPKRIDLEWAGDGGQADQLLPRRTVRGRRNEPSESSEESGRSSSAPVADTERAAHRRDRKQRQKRRRKHLEEHAEALDLGTTFLGPDGVESDADAVSGPCDILPGMGREELDGDRIGRELGQHGGALPQPSFLQGGSAVAQRVRWLVRCSWIPGTAVETWGSVP